MYIHVEFRKSKTRTKMKKLDAGYDVKGWMLYPNYTIRRSYSPTTEGEADFELDRIESKEDYWETMKVAVAENNKFSCN